MKRALNYNEHKVQQQKAELIHAANFLQKPEELKFKEKLARFENLMERNQRAETKVIHISLNFPPVDESKLNKEFLKQVCDEYMEKLGFKDQPYLVYQHHDSGHPHVHIISSLIRDDGSRIPTHNLGKDVSKPATIELEEKYGLTRADKDEQSKNQEQALKIDPESVLAGKSETKRSITNVLDHVIGTYKYTSLEELNAVLRQYNVRADRGAENGRIYKNRGLMYSVINDEGKQMTKPIKASEFHNKPTLDNIESRFKANELNREPDKKHVRTAIEWALHKAPRSLEDLAKELQKERIAIIASRSVDGRIFGLTFVDHEHKAVFKGSDLGKKYSAKNILERLTNPEKQNVQQQEKTSTKQKEAEREDVSKEKTLKPENVKSTSSELQSKNSAERKLATGVGKIIEEVVQPGHSSGGANKELTEEEKRRRRKQQEFEQDN